MGRGGTKRGMGARIHKRACRERQSRTAQSGHATPAMLPPLHPRAGSLACAGAACAIAHTGRPPAEGWQPGMRARGRTAVGQPRRQLKHGAGQHRIQQRVLLRHAEKQDATHSERPSGAREHSVCDVGWLAPWVVHCCVAACRAIDDRTQHGDTGQLDGDDGPAGKAVWHSFRPRTVVAGVQVGEPARERDTVAL